MSIKFNHKKKTVPEALGLKVDRSKEIKRLYLKALSMQMNNELPSTKSALIEYVFSHLNDKTDADLILIGVHSDMPEYGGPVHLLEGLLASFCTDAPKKRAVKKATK